MLTRMDHRGACGCEANTGDGAGILTDIPHEFFSLMKSKDPIQALDVAPGSYGVGNVFLAAGSKRKRFLHHL